METAGLHHCELRSSQDGSKSQDFGRLQVTISGHTDQAPPAEKKLTGSQWAMEGRYARESTMLQNAHSFSLVLAPAAGPIKEQSGESPAKQAAVAPSMKVCFPKTLTACL